MIVNCKLEVVSFDALRVLILLDINRHYGVHVFRAEAFTGPTINSRFGQPMIGFTDSDNVTASTRVEPLK
jgi:hypothetical protein